MGENVKALRKENKLGDEVTNLSKEYQIFKDKMAAAETTKGASIISKVKSSVDQSL